MQPSQNFNDNLPGRKASVTPLSSPQERAIRDTTGQDIPVNSERRLERRKRLIYLAAVLTIGALAGIALLMQSWSSTAAVVPVERLRIASVERGPFIRDVAAQGVVVAAVSPTLYATAEGKLKLLVTAGETVKKDQVLATLDSPALTNELDRERATLEALDIALERHSIEVRRQELHDAQASDLAQVQVNAADRELERLEGAWQQRVVPEYLYKRAIDDAANARLTHRHSIENAKLQRESLGFEIRSKRSERDRQRLTVKDLQRRVAELNVRSPVDGIVGNLAVAQDAAVAHNAPLLSVVDLSAFEVEFRVPETYAETLGLGVAAEVAYMGKTYTATVTAVSPEVRDNEVTGRVRFSDSTPPGLRQNQRVNVRIVIDSRPDVIQVERGNFTDAGGWAYVVVDDRATRRAIKLGAMSIRDVEIVSGLAVGERIIINDPAGNPDAPVLRLIH